MAVFRIEKTRDYTVMSNHHLKNKNLTLKAKGLLSVMLSLPETWDYTLKGLAIINREGVDAIREAVRELEKAGYIVRTRVRNAKGQLTGTEYVIYEQPQAPQVDESEQPVSDQPTSEKPVLEIQYWITRRWRILRGKTLYWETCVGKSNAIKYS